MVQGEKLHVLRAVHSKLKTKPRFGHRSMQLPSKEIPRTKVGSMFSQLNDAQGAKNGPEIRGNGSIALIYDPSCGSYQIPPQPKPIFLST